MWFSYRLRVVNRILQSPIVPSFHSLLLNFRSIGVQCNPPALPPVFRASAQGGDRYPKHGADQSDHVLPQNRRRPDGTGKAGVRCPRSRSNPANQIAELPHKPKAGAFGCGHRNDKNKKQRTDLTESLSPAFSICFL